MKYQKDGSSYVVRIDRGEDVMQKLCDFACEANVHSATITGIGAASEIELGIYSAEISSYKHYTPTQAISRSSRSPATSRKKTGQSMSISTAWSRTARV